jgi:hypothetical protein
MRDSTPMLRSEAFNEAFDNFDDAFVKALATSNPRVFALYETVMANLRILPEAEAIAKLKAATFEFFDCTADHKMKNAEADWLNMYCITVSESLIVFSIIVKCVASLYKPTILLTV